MLARVVLDTNTANPVTPAARASSAAPAAGPAAPAAAAADPVAPPRRRPRPRLTHVDAMRPVKQFGVVSTHSLQNFAPAASLGVGGSLMLTHVTRFAFMFISAAMLVYAYPAVGRGGWPAFWHRRLLAVVLPYATWTVVYFALGLAQAGRIGSIADDAGHLGWLLLTGYDQLYFLVVLLQFYLIYPAFLWLIRQTQRHHGWLLGVSLAVEVVLFWLVHEQYVPAWMLNKGATRELWNYELFVVVGGVVAWHYHEVHVWLVRYWRPLLAATGAAVALSETWFVLASRGVPGFRTADPSDRFEPVEIPLYLGLITVIYLLGVVMGMRADPAGCAPGRRRGGLLLRHLPQPGAVAHRADHDGLVVAGPAPALAAGDRRRHRHRLRGVRAADRAAGPAARRPGHGRHPPLPLAKPATTRLHPIRPPGQRGAIAHVLTTAMIPRRPLRVRRSGNVLPVMARLYVYPGTRKSALRVMVPGDSGREVHVGFARGQRAEGRRATCGTVPRCDGNWRCCSACWPFSPPRAEPSGEPWPSGGRISPPSGRGSRRRKAGPGRAATAPAGGLPRESPVGPTGRCSPWLARRSRRAWSSPAPATPAEDLARMMGWRLQDSADQGPGTSTAEPAAAGRSPGWPPGWTWRVPIRRPSSSRVATTISGGPCRSSGSGSRASSQRSAARRPAPGSRSSPCSPAVVRPRAQPGLRTRPSSPPDATPTLLSSCSTRSPATGIFPASAITCTPRPPATGGSPSAWR